MSQKSHGGYYWGGSRKIMFSSQSNRKNGRMKKFERERNERERKTRFEINNKKEHLNKIDQEVIKNTTENNVKAYMNHPEVKRYKESKRNRDKCVMFEDEKEAGERLENNGHTYESRINNDATYKKHHCGHCKGHCKGGSKGEKGNKGEAGEKGDTGDKGDKGDPGMCNIKLKGDKGTAIPNDEGELCVVGSRVIQTCGEENKLRIMDNAYLSEFVVDPNPDNYATYDNLDEAIKAAAALGSEFPVSIFLRPGNYVLEENTLSNNAKINIIGVSMGGRPCAFISGSSTSWGNKYWYSVQFNNLETEVNPLDTYTLNNPSPNVNELDQFWNCYFYNNYKVTVVNENIKIIDCLYDEPELKRTNGIIELQDGAGFIEVQRCEFNFNRKSGSPAQALIYINAGTDVRISIIQDCEFNGIVSASSQNPVTFNMITIANNQLVKFVGGNVRINPNKNTDTPVNIFGPANRDEGDLDNFPGYSIDVNLFVEGGVYGGPSENTNENYFLMYNLYSNDVSIDAISIRNIELDGARLIKYDIERPTINANKKPINNIVIHACEVIEQASQLFSILIGGNIRFNLYISSCRFQSEDSNPVFEWIQALDGSVDNNIFLSLTSVEMFNSFLGNDSFPRWLETAVECSPFMVHDPTDPNQPLIQTNGFAYFRSDTSIYNYKPGTNVSNGTKPDVFEYANANIV